MRKCTTQEKQMRKTDMRHDLFGFYALFFLTDSEGFQIMNIWLCVIDALYITLQRQMLPTRLPNEV